MAPKDQKTRNHSTDGSIQLIFSPYIYTEFQVILFLHLLTATLTPTAHHTTILEVDMASTPARLLALSPPGARLATTLI